MIPHPPLVTGRGPVSRSIGSMEYRRNVSSGSVPIEHYDFSIEKWPGRTVVRPDDASVRFEREVREEDRIIVNGNRAGHLRLGVAFLPAAVGPGASVLRSAVGAPGGRTCRANRAFTRMNIVLTVVEEDIGFGPKTACVAKCVGYLDVQAFQRRGRRG